MNIDAMLNNRELRRAKAEDRWVEKMDRLYPLAESMIGELCREGKTVYYIYPVGGRYREGNYFDLVNFLIRNRYVH